MPDVPGGSDLRDYSAFLRRRRKWLALGVLLGLGAAVAFLLVAPRTYVSAARVNVESTVSEGSSDDRTNSGINLDTEAQLVTSAAVIEEAADLMDTDATARNLASRVSVSIPANTTIMAISFSAPTAAEAQRGAQAFADAYLDNRSQAGQDVVDSEIERLQGQIDEAAAQLRQIAVRLNNEEALGAAERAQLKARRTFYIGRLTALNAELAPLSGTAVSAGSVINEAEEPRAPTDPNPVLIGPSGVLAGLVLGLGIALLRERADDRIHDVGELEHRFGLVPLDSIASLDDRRLAEHQAARIYHSVRARSRSLPSILVVSPGSDNDAVLASLLARSSARANDKTSYLSRELGPTKDIDAELLALVDQEVLELVRYEDLGLVSPDGVLPGRLSAELNRMRANGRVLVLEPPSDDLLLDLPIMVQHVNVVLLLVEPGRTRRALLKRALADMSISHDAHVFAIAVDTARSRSHITRRSSRPS